MRSLPDEQAFLILFIQPFFSAGKEKPLQLVTVAVLKNLRFFAF
jgi:hypothetical protein